MINKDTENLSFINMWRYLQDMDVENNTFMLELYDESLKNFKITDLHTEDKKERIKLVEKLKEECKKNIWFFFREIVRIPNPVALASKQIHLGQSHYILNQTEMRMIYAYQHGISLFTKLRSIPRGVHTTLRLLEYYEYLFGEPKDASIIEYENGNDDLIQYNAFNSNFTIFPDTYYGRNDSFHVFRTMEDKVQIQDEDSTKIFVYVDREFDKENFYKNLYDLKIGKLYPVSMYGYMIRCNEKLSEYEKLIENMMFHSIPFDFPFFDKTNQLDKSRIYIQ